jgi:hypothetical protein
MATVRAFLAEEGAVGELGERRLEDFSRARD